MASSFLPQLQIPQIFGRETTPSPEIQASLAGQAAQNVANRKSQLLDQRLQLSEPQQFAQPPQPASQLLPQQPAQQPQFMSQQQPTINPNTVIARRPGGVVTMPTGMVVRSQQPTEGEIAANADVAEQQARFVGAQKDLLEQRANWVEKEAEVKERLVGIEEQSQARRAEIEQNRSRAMESGLTKLNYLTEEVKNGEIKNYWADKSTGSRVLSAIAVGLGAAAQAFGAGPNPAMQILNQAIEADLVKQKTNLAKGRENLENQQTLMAETSKLFDNDLVAEEGARLTAYKVVANELEVMASKAQSDEIRSRIVERLNAVNLLVSQSEQAFQQSLRSDVTQQFASKYIAPRTVTVGDVMTEQAKQQGYVDYREMTKDKKTDNFVPEYGGFARSPSEAKDMRQGNTVRGTAKNILNKLIQFRKSHGQWDVLKPGEKAYASALHQELMNLKKGRSMDDLGVIAGADLQMLLTSAPKPNDLYSMAEDRYRAVIDTINMRDQADRNNVLLAAPETIPPIYRRAAIQTQAERGVK